MKFIKLSKQTMWKLIFRKMRKSQNTTVGRKSQNTTVGRILVERRTQVLLMQSNTYE